MATDPKAPIERTSLNGGIESLYANSNGQFKKAGTVASAAQSDSQFETDFQVKNVSPTLTDKALNYANSIRVNTVPYAPSGRRES